MVEGTLTAAGVLVRGLDMASMVAVAAGCKAVACVGFAVGVAWVAPATGAATAAVLRIEEAAATAAAAAA